MFEDGIMVIPISQGRKLRVELLVTQARPRGQPVLQLGLQPRRALYRVLVLAHCRATQRARHVVVVVTVTVFSLSSFYQLDFFPPECHGQFILLIGDKILLCSILKVLVWHI